MLEFFRKAFQKLLLSPCCEYCEPPYSFHHTQLSPPRPKSFPPTEYELLGAVRRACAETAAMLRNESYKDSLPDSSSKLAAVLPDSLCLVEFFAILEDELGIDLPSKFTDTLLDCTLVEVATTIHATYYQ